MLHLFKSMHRGLRYFAVAGCSVFSLLLSYAGNAATENLPRSITITTGEYAPFNSSSLKYSGLIPRVIAEAFSREGIEVTFAFYPWARAFELSKAGQVDGTAHWYESEERRKTHLYSDPVLEETIVWFHLKGKPFDWTDLRSLAGLRIGAVLGYTYTREFHELAKAGDLYVEFVGDDEQNYKKLLAGRIDIVPETLDVGLYIINRHYPRETAQLFDQHPKPFFTTKTYLLMPKSRPHSAALIAAFNKGLAALREEGLLEVYLLESREGRYHPD